MTRSAEDLIVGAGIFLVILIVGGLILTLVFGDARVGFFLSFIAGIVLGGGGFAMFYKKW